jgi:hypothetical protein
MAGTPGSRALSHYAARVADLGDLGSRARAVALAALGSACMARLAFGRSGAYDPDPVAMEILAAIGLQQTLAVDGPACAALGWLSVALGQDDVVVERAVVALIADGLVERSSDYQGEIAYQRAEAGNLDAAWKVPVELTDRGIEAVERWLRRVGNLMGGWPPDNQDVDDADAPT